MLWGLREQRVEKEERLPGKTVSTYIPSIIQKTYIDANNLLCYWHLFFALSGGFLRAGNQLNLLLFFQNLAYVSGPIKISCITIEQCLAMKKDEILQCVATWLEQEEAMGEWFLEGKDENQMIFLICRL